MVLCKNASYSWPFCRSVNISLYSQLALCTDCLREISLFFRLNASTLCSCTNEPCKVEPYLKLVFVHSQWPPIMRQMGCEMPETEVYSLKTGPNRWVSVPF